jgi:hypothetical protein
LLIEVTAEQLQALLSDRGVAAEEQARYDRIEALIESTLLPGNYQVVDTTVLT